jgi:ubiquinone/menaquinone biosynthesis C-methylase UbiE
MFSINFWKVYSKHYDKLNGFLPYRKYLYDLASGIKTLDNGIYLDAGCGTGNLLSTFRKGGIFIGIDSSRDMIKLAVKKSNSILIQADLNRRLVFRDCVFDGVFSSNVLAYVKDPCFVVGEFYRILKQGGKVCLATPKIKFSLIKLFFAHSKDSTFFGFLKTAIPLIILGILNLKILLDARNKTAHFFNQDEIFSMFNRAAFKNIQISSTYSNQDWLVLAEK